MIMDESVGYKSWPVNRPRLLTHMTRYPLTRPSVGCLLGNLAWSMIDWRMVSIFSNCYLWPWMTCKVT